MIPAGGSGKLKAKVKTSTGRSGRQNKSIAVHTSSPAAGSIRLTLGYNVVTPIVASPSYRIYVNGVEGTPETHKLLLHRADGQPLEAKIDKVSAGDGVDVRLETVTTPEAGQGKVMAQVGDLWLVTEVGEVPGGFVHSGLVVLSTNHPESPRLDIPMSLRMRPLIDVRPGTVQLWPADGGPGGTEVYVRLSHSQRVEFEVKAVEVADPKLISAELISEGAQKIHSVRVFLPEEFAGVESSVSTSVRISTSEVGKPVFDLPVTVSPRHAALRRSVRRPVPKPAGSPGGK